MSIPNPPYHDHNDSLLYAILQYYLGNAQPMFIPQPPFHKTTSRLLFEILNNLNTPAPPPVIYEGFRVLYVSSRYGNNATAEPNNIAKPFKTITAAKNIHFIGDIIHVMEGVYNEGHLSGNYRYWFDFGADVTYSGSGAIFHQEFGECIVRGYGKFKCTGDAVVINVGNWLNCILDIECESIEAVERAVVLWQNRPLEDPINYKPHRIKARRIYSQNHKAVHGAFNAHFEVEADEIISDSLDQPAVAFNQCRLGIIKNSTIIANNFYGVEVFMIFLTIDNCKIKVNSDLSISHGIWIRDALDRTSISNTNISCKNVAARSIFSDATTSVFLDNNVTANRDTGGALINYLNKGTKVILESSEAILDITGLASIDLTNYQNIDVFRLTSANLSETINEITSAPLYHNYTLRPDNGLSLTLVSTPPIGATNSSIVLESPSIILNGSNGDWIELRNTLYGLGNRQVRASIY